VFSCVGPSQAFKRFLLLLLLLLLPLLLHYRLLGVL
jgi:hypothetical protein